MAGRPSADEIRGLELTQKGAFLSAYETRIAQCGIFTVASELGIPKSVVIRWLQDPTFRDSLTNIDAWRMVLVRETFARALQGAIDNVATLSRQPTRLGLRAAALIAKWNGLHTTTTINQLTQVNAQQNINLLSVRPSPDQVATVWKDYRRLSRIVTRYGKNGKGNGDVPAEADPE